MVIGTGVKKYTLYLTCMHDTIRSIEERMSRMMALKSPAERLSMAGSMFDASKKLMTAGLLKENPGLSAARLREGIFRRLYEGLLYRKRDAKGNQQDAVIQSSRSSYPSRAALPSPVILPEVKKPICAAMRCWLNPRSRSSTRMS
jgi:hypothetical protein